MNVIHEYNGLLHALEHEVSSMLEAANEEDAAYHRDNGKAIARKLAAIEEKENLI